MKAIAKNPILPGFNPDPSIVRVGNDYYLATSTFEWFPGVQIFHSRDLASWELVARPLNRKSQLDLVGVADSGGVWAPCLSYSNGVFYLAYTIVRNTRSIWRDMRNYLVTCDRIDGDWCEPVFLNGTGHDPSLFHDDDGRKWLVNAQWAYFNGKNVFDGIVLQEYSPEKEALVGPIKNIFKGTNRGWTEAPHLYKVDGYYYLLTAEGGTWYDHCATIARSKTLDGPYEALTEPLLTSSGKPDLEIQKAGHGDILQTDEGWFIVHLCGRPLTTLGNCPLGRETAIQRIVWKKHWPQLADEVPQKTVETLTLNPVHDNRNLGRDHFDTSSLNMHYQFLRTAPKDGVFDLTARPGYLRIKGQEAFSSLHEQSILARRVQAFNYTIETALEFVPKSSRDMAGLVVYYNSENYIYFCVTKNKREQVCLQVYTCFRNEFDAPLQEGIPVENGNRVLLRCQVNGAEGKLSYSLDGEMFTPLSLSLCMDKLSDDYIKGRSFTGTFVGICCQALGADQTFADFDYFDYVENTY